MSLIINQLSNRIWLLYALAISVLSCKYSSEERKNVALAIHHTHYVNQSELALSIERGTAIYTEFCVACHRTDGEGVSGSFPPLAGSDYLRNNRIESIKAVKFGQQGVIIVNGVTYNGVMAAQGLEDEEVADVLNYVMNSWGNTEKNRITPAEVRAIRK